MEVKRHGYRPLMRALCFLVAWVFGIVFISYILFYFSCAFLSWLFAASYTFILCSTFCYFFEEKSVWDLGLRVGKSSVLNFVLGVFVGMSMITTVFLLEYGLRLVIVELNSGFDIIYLIYGLLMSLFVGFMEELVFRGYFFQNALLSLDENLSILLSSIIFGLMHIFNPHVSFLAVIVISVIGVLLAICYLKTQTLYLPMGVHFAWNFFEGFVYGFPISGNKVQGFLITRVEGSTWLTFSKTPGSTSFMSSSEALSMAASSLDAR